MRCVLPQVVDVQSFYRIRSVLFNRVNNGHSFAIGEVEKAVAQLDTPLRDNAVVGESSCSSCSEEAVAATESETAPPAMNEEVACGLTRLVYEVRLTAIR